MSKRPARGVKGGSLVPQLQFLRASLMTAAAAAVLLRLFLGGTMLYAGVDKMILDARFLQEDGVGSIGETLRLLSQRADHSPRSLRPWLLGSPC